MVVATEVRWVGCRASAILWGMYLNAPIIHMSQIYAHIFTIITIIKDNPANAFTWVVKDNNICLKKIKQVLLIQILYIFHINHIL